MKHISAGDQLLIWNTFNNVYCFKTMVFLKHYNWPSNEILKEANLVWKEDILYPAKNSKKKK